MERWPSHHLTSHPPSHIPPSHHPRLLLNTSVRDDQILRREADECVSAVPRSGDLAPAVVGATVAHLAMAGDEIEIRRQTRTRKVAQQPVDEGRLAIEIGVERE